MRKHSLFDSWSLEANLDDEDKYKMDEKLKQIKIKFVEKWMI
jgi:hypothetical protein